MGKLTLAAIMMNWTSIKILSILLYLCTFNLETLKVSLYAFN